MKAIRLAVPIAMAVVLIMGGCDSTLRGNPRIDPLADQSLKAMSDTLDSAKSFRFHVESEMDEELPGGQLVQLSRDSRIWVRRPDKLHVETTGDEVSRLVWFDGKTLTILDRTTNTYASFEAPGNIEQMLDKVMSEYDLFLPVADLLFRKSYESFTDNVQSGRYLGAHSVGDTKSHHIIVRYEMVDCQIWIDAGDVALPRKLTIVDKQRPGHPSYSAVMDDWDLDATIGEDRFLFRPPAAAERVEMDDLFDTLTGE